ncbi:hypothetical protein GW943_02005 [Candidatus Parcubacteria bacterium]|uniref:Uncharacterized protein n=1 Tax=Candidatus Kaiserbacteria bacterium CG10_big_fil_rev_8_21_14_0_10_47_16 TaxID=1974608 RepID=A0A2H0UEF9_9BACT|nr:hypothetical protein [Candidatus Parcubacteria bacterium]PIR84803.1 MAG: hypothetical protein COU16_01295 [Candidatus Kaiserbacteria bacterium CG10_big_fil_rev_8_21_14_0_10_47_16]
MGHPFAKMFETALSKSTPTDNAVLTEAMRLLGKGYSPEEIFSVLERMSHGRLDDDETEILVEAVEEFETYRP